MSDIPVIDIRTITSASSEGAETVRALGEACRTFGFFQVIGHDMSRTHLDRVWSSAKQFFALPLAEKRQLSRSLQNPMGYYDRELTKNKRDQKEIFDFVNVPHPTLPDDHPDNVSSVDGMNRWPESMPEFRTIMKEHFSLCTELAHKLLDAFCVDLAIQPGFFRSAFGSDHASFMRLNHYPVDDVLEESERNSVTALGELALGQHTDAGVLTVLMQDGNGGLQVEVDGNWMDVPPTDGAFVINVGDMMQVWSNDHFRAANHRVVPVRRASRYSIPFFFNPAYETVCEPIVRSGEVSRYRPVKWGDFRSERAKGDFADYGKEIQITALRDAAEAM